MIYKLPYDLKEAESQILISLLNFLNSHQNENVNISIQLKFDGIRFNPVIFRLSDNLLVNNYTTSLIWSDAGSAALAKRDMPHKINNIFTYKEYLSDSNSDIDNLLIAVCPQPYDIEQFESVCHKHQGHILMFNGKLEDPIVGIGSVGRERRKRFIDKWRTIYSLEPLSRGALLKQFNTEWLLFSLDQSGYAYKSKYESRPDDETILLAL